MQTATMTCMGCGHKYEVDVVTLKKRRNRAKVLRLNSLGFWCLDCLEFHDAMRQLKSKK